MSDTIYYCESCNKTKKNVLDEIEACRQRGGNENTINSIYTQKYIEFWKGFITKHDFKEGQPKDVCPYCGGKLIDTNFPYDDIFVFAGGLDYNRPLLEAMIELHNKDIIEYELKMGQFRKQVEDKKQQQRQDREQRDNTPKCPTCGSTDIEKISTTSKVVGGALFGLFSSNVRKTMHCKNCGYKW